MLALKYDYNIDPLRESISVTQVLRDIAGVEVGRGQYACWLHSDKHPSGRVSKDDKRFTCFQCGAGGSVYDVAMLALNLSFKESKKYLYEYYGFNQPSFRTKEAKRHLKKVREEREIEQAFNEKIDCIYSDIAAMHRAIFMYDDGRLEHISMQLEQLMDELMSNDNKVKVDAVRFAEKWWI